MKPLLYVVGAVVGAAAIVCAVFVWVLPAGERVDCAVDGMRVIIPQARGRLPVVFLAHNGGATKEDWGDFPDELSKKGYAVVNMGWTEFKGADDFKKNYATVTECWGKRLNLKRVAFVGGCHGGIKMLASLETKVPFKTKALVFLSMSELYSPPAHHAPILGIYCLKDHLGDGYVATQKKVYESVLSEPKTVISLDATPHGNELVTDASTRDHVRSEVAAWLKTYL
jgi:hypothetical protein